MFSLLVTILALTGAVTWIFILYVLVNIYLTEGK
jgi:hypothetical protein